MSSVKKDIRTRVYLSFTFIVLFGVAIVGKVAHIQIKEGDALKAKANKAHTKTEALIPDRGNIYTEDGKILSATIPKFDLRLDFSVMNKDTFNNYVDTISKELANIFKDNSSAIYRRKLTTAFKEQKRYYLLKKNVTFYDYQAVRGLPLFNKPKNRSGFIAEPKTKRVNPYKMLAYRTIGLWRENAQVIGLENAYNDSLAGVSGSRLLRKIAAGEWMPIEGSEVDPISGKDIVTTLDIGIQAVTEHSLMEVMEKYECLQGTAIVMEVHTGKIKAIANLGRQKNGEYWEDYNYALLASEPGSVFKVLSLYSLIEDGYETINSTVNCFGGLAKFGRQTVRDDHKGLGVITFEKAFAQSSNVAFAYSINKHYQNNPMKYINHLKEWGLDKKTGIDLPGEQRTVIKTTKSKSWNKVTSLPWIAYGYESMITPLHTTMVYNTIANNGRMMKPYLVSAIQEDGKDVQRFEPVVLKEQIGKLETIKQLQAATRAVVQNGTGKAAQSPYYLAAGKTGTAQVSDLIGGVRYHYGDGVRQGSFVGYFPADNPQYTITVVVRSKPHGVYYGAALGVPVFKAIADKLYTTKIGGWKVNADSLSKDARIVTKVAPANQILSLANTLNLPIQKNKVNTVLADVDQLDGQKQYNIIPKSIPKQGTPNVVGMGLKEALFLLENSGLTVQVVGSGTVLNQSIAPGTQHKKGNKIIIQLG